jgi:hypothetical protein
LGDRQDGTATIIREMSGQKKTMIAASVPRCRATSNARPNSEASHPKKNRARMRCAELEIGRNSVTP